MADLSKIKLNGTVYNLKDAAVPSWAKASTKPTYTNTEVGAAASSHTHGSITNAGAITSNTAFANGDRLVFSDSSDSNILKRSSITIGTSTTQFLANNGTWQTPAQYDDSALAARVQALENLEWATYYSGRSNPSNSQGKNGDIYLQY